MQKFEHVLPSEIEKRSFEIITQELGEDQPDPVTAPVVKRVIHASADFDYAKNLCFSEDVIPKSLAALKAGALVITDTRMAWSGINKKVLESLGGEALCFMADEDVALEAKASGTTRATHTPGTAHTAAVRRFSVRRCRHFPIGKFRPFSVQSSFGFAVFRGSFRGCLCRCLCRCFYSGRRRVCGLRRALRAACRDGRRTQHDRCHNCKIQITFFHKNTASPFFDVVKESMMQ